ncbi:MAG: hypothetical protein J5506_04530 [Prevotella sp.]|nr:hypothetical protein [Prevotella sp.]
MKSRTSFIFLAAWAVAVSCSGGMEKNQPEDTETSEPAIVLEGDSTIYGMACEGTSDSLLVFLPDSGGNPVSYDILQARIERRIVGRITTGDNLALLLNDDSAGTVRSIIDIDQLKGSWAYMVMPQLKERFKNMPARKDGPSQAVLDSMLNRLMVPREYGMKLLRDNTVERIGSNTRRQRNENSPVEYPRQPRYTEWHIWNGKLIFTAGNINMPEINERYKHEVSHDTADIVFLRKDSLQLRFADGIRSYYRKKE